MALQPAALGIIFNEDQSQILLVKRKDIPLWVFPGGGIDKGETKEEALKREILEETGYHVNLIRQCAEFYPINRLTSVTSLFLCQIISKQTLSSSTQLSSFPGSLVQSGDVLSDEISAINFFPLHNLPSSFFIHHANWLNEVLSNPHFIKRPLKEITYKAFLLYFLRHPWIVIRYVWTRFSSRTH